jgi:hypothetical protein
MTMTVIGNGGNLQFLMDIHGNLSIWMTLLVSARKVVTGRIHRLEKREN